MPSPSVPVGLSTASVFPEPAPGAFAAAAKHGYDGIEVLVQSEPATQNADTLLQLMDEHQLPVLSVHSPCLLVTAAVWSTDPLVKLSRSIELAERVGARTVVAHPPFVWQRAAAEVFAEAVAELQDRTEVAIAIENMFPIKVAGALVNSFRPHWDPVPAGHRHYTLDLSHTAASGADAMDMLRRMGRGLHHLHLTDGSGSTKDEHLVPGRGRQPCAEVLGTLADNGFDGAVVVEINTRSGSAEQRELDLAQSLAFARLHLPGPLRGAGG